MEVVLETETPDGVAVALPALVYAKVLEEHNAVADLALTDLTIRSPHERRHDPRPSRERFLRRQRGMLDVQRWRTILRYWLWLSSALFLRRSSPCSRQTLNEADVGTATVHVIVADLQLSGSYDELGDVLYLSAPVDDKTAPVHETPEGHAVRLDADGHVAHITAINAKWLLNRDGELVATLRDGRSLRLSRADVADLITE